MCRSKLLGEDSEGNTYIEWHNVQHVLKGKADEDVRTHYRSVETRFPDFPGVQPFLSRHRGIFLCTTPAPAIPDVVYLRKPASHWVVRDEQFASICALLDRMPSSSEQHTPLSSSSSSQQQSRPLNGPKVEPLSSSPPTTTATSATATTIPTEEGEIEAQPAKQADQTNTNPASASTQSSVPALSAADQERLMAPPADSPSDQIVGIVQGQEITPSLSAADQEPSLSRNKEVTIEAIAEDALHVGSDHIAMNTLDETKDDDNTTSGQNEGGEDGDGGDDKYKDGVDSSVILQALSPSPSQSQESTQNHHNIDTAEATTANSKSLTMKLLERGGDIRALLLSHQPLSSLRAQTADSGNEGGEPKNDSKDENEDEVEEQRFVRPPRLRFALSDAKNDGTSPLSVAAQYGHLTVVQYLLEQGADKEKANNNGASPLFLAAQNGHLGVVQKLLEQGANVNKANNVGVSPLWIAAYYGHLVVVQFLLEQGADKDKTRSDGSSPLWIAALQGHLGVVQYLLEHGADKNKAKNDNTTSISIAAQNGHLAVVQYLLEQGVDKDKADNDGYSPLFVAAQEGHLPVVQYLLEQGADKDKTNNNGLSPLFIASV